MCQLSEKAIIVLYHPKNYPVNSNKLSKLWLKICGGLDFNEKGCWVACLNTGGI